MRIFADAEPTTLPQEEIDEFLRVLMTPAKETFVVPEISLSNGNKIPAKHQKCPKCLGSGHLVEYNHVSRGICFRCDGHGYVRNYA